MRPLQCCRANTTLRKLALARCSLILGACLCTNSAMAQYVNDVTVSPPPRRPPMAPLPSLFAPEAADAGTGADVLVAPTMADAPLFYFNSSVTARGAIVADDTRLEDFAAGSFLPSAIPVEGQPFYGSDSRAALQASGNAIRINAFSPATADYSASASAQLMVNNAAFTADDSLGNANVSLRQIVGRLNRLTIGIMDSAFSDPSAVPETIDLAGPNARVTVYDAGTGDGQGRISYDLLSDEPEGFEIIASAEEAIPEIAIPDTDSTFSHTPDFVLASQYVEGSIVEGRFVERWHLQLGSVFRDLGFEEPSSEDQNVFGWGTSLSGAYKFPSLSHSGPMDRVMFSVTYGEGISHYIGDLNAANDAGDAVIDAAGTLDPLPVLAWYTAYNHYWNPCLRSTFTYSQVDLDSTIPLGAPASPYRSGQYVAGNLVRRIMFSSEPEDTSQRNIFTGIEYLYGHKDTLDGADGEANRIMVLLMITN